MDLDYDYAAYPSTAPASSSPAAAYSQLLRAAALSRGGGRRAPAIAGGGSLASRLAGKLVSVILTCIFAIVGSFVGAITGALIGLATESGLFCGAGIGAISGAVFSVEAVESSIAIWHSHGSGIWSLIFVLDIILSLLSGTIVQEKVGPALQSAVQSQMSAIDGPYREQLDIFETETKRGMPSDSIRKLPKIKITEGCNLDASGEKICCSVCLQDFQVGETVRMLPECQHMFHIPCIDGWLADHGSCPLCRRGF